MARAIAIKLSIVEGEESGQTITFDGERLVLGRSKKVDLVLSDRAISREHSAIEREGDDYVLVDLGSNNGTFIEGKGKIERHVLESGDEVRLGRVRLLVDVQRPVEEKPAAFDEEATAVITPGPTGRPASEPTPPAVADAERPRQEKPAPLPSPEAASGVTSRPGAEPPPRQEREGVGAQLPADLSLVLTVVSGPDRGQVYCPVGETITIGRLPTSDVPLNDSAVSRVHATIIRDRDGFTIRDENSSNGTELGSPPKRILHTRLREGDVLRLGATEIEVSIGAGGSVRAPRVEADQTVLFGTIGDKTFSMSLKGLASRMRPAMEEVDFSAETRILTRGGTTRLRFRVSGGPAAGTTIEPPAAQSQFTVGRSERADYTISDPTMSGVHFSVNRDGNDFLLTDANSRNGTFLGDGKERVTSATLKDGDEIRAGDSVLVAEIRADAPRLEAAPAAPARGDAPRAAAPEEDLVPELARSAEAKERISKIMKGVSLRVVRTPGTPRQWASLVLILVAAVLSLGFAMRWPSLLAAGPLSESHADLDNRDDCTTCHVKPSAMLGSAAHEMSVACADCHTDIVRTNTGEQEDCTGCHQEHRGRLAPLAAGPDQCWSCHRGGEGVQDFDTRLMTQLVRADAAALEALNDRPDRVEIGLVFSHLAHDAETKGDPQYDNCIGCHPVVEDGRTFALPSHPECIDCHDNVGDADPAKAVAGPDCLQCHTRESGEIAEVKPSLFDYVVFSHVDHTEEFCQSCHASIWDEEKYESVFRASDVYPLDMDACYTCHDQKNATVDCLPCHREHHLIEGDPGVIAAAVGPFGLDGFLVGLVILSLGGFAYVWADARLVRRWLGDTGGPLKAESSGASAPAGEVMPFPEVDAEACISCSSCYGSCPKDVLAGDDHGKSVVVNPDSCIALEGCSICEQGCPTGAIRVTTAPLIRVVERPDADENNEARALPGLFFVGEVIGAALIKSAINQGTDAVRFIHDKKPRIESAPYDVIVVGAGPGGLGAGLEAKRLGLRYKVVERDTIASTIQNYPRDKAVLAEPIKVPLYGMLPMMDAQKETLIAVWQAVVETAQLEVMTRESAVDISKSGDLFTVKTANGEYQAPYVVLAVGTRGNPRLLGCPGEGPDTVQYNLIDPGEWGGKKVIVVGGGDSAVEAAVALGKAGATTILSYRKAEFGRVKSRNKQAIDEAVKEGKVELVLKSQVKEIQPGKVVLSTDAGDRQVECDQIFALIGAEPPKAWIEKMGVAFMEVQEEVVKWG